MVLLGASRPATLNWVFGGGITELLLVGKMMPSKVVIRMDSCTDGSGNLLENLGCLE